MSDPLDECMERRAMGLALLQQMKLERDAAIDALTRAGFTLVPGCAWKPPVNERNGELIRKIMATEQERDAAEKRCEELQASLRDMFAGWQYIRQHHGDLYGVGWDRCEHAARQALTTAEAAASLKRGVADFQAGRTTPMPAADMDTP